MTDSFKVPQLILRIALGVGFLTPVLDRLGFLDRQGDTLLEEAFAVMFDNGEMERHFRKSLKIYKQRRNFFCSILKSDFSDKIEFRTPEGGLAVWANFDKKIDLIKCLRCIKKKAFYRQWKFL